jgi:hypothetical protein
MRARPHTTIQSLIVSLERLQHPERPPRVLPRRLWELNKEVLQEKLDRYLSPAKLDALETRRTLPEKHFEEQIGSGEAAVLYSLLPEIP